MAQKLTCSRGHCWEVADGSVGDESPCPYCGALANTLVPFVPGRSTHPKSDPTSQAGETLVRPVPPITAARPAADATEETLRPHPNAPSGRVGSSVTAPVSPPFASDTPGYEILGVLGRGGMGVVYKAKQLGLKRLVALKMILGGAHADVALLSRFRVEAESAARLQHPNIVQVYEVGEQNGLPYFSLEYVAGGSLDRLLAGQPQPGRPTARLLETIARAMHYAHEHGIIHRDLKPANILMAAPPGAEEQSAELLVGPAPMDSWRSTIPKITDFGLAKQLEDDSGQTRTGTLIGTPSYMAPEQAAGHGKLVGPAADIYALGAILYECLTGRPPFKAATALDTVAQVLNDDPVPPQRLNSRVDRDLEIICLKCLHKEPTRRYASALALAEDLHRFVVGEPIQARPASLAERVLKWSRRRPALMAVVAVSVVALLTLLGAGFYFNLRLRDERDLAQQERQRAQKNFDRALRAVDQMLTEVAEVDLIREPRMEQKRRKLLEGALRFYQEFLEEKSSDPTIRRETGLASKRLADIQRLLEQNAAAQQSYQQAIALLGALAQEFPEEPIYRLRLAESHNYLGEILRTDSHLKAAKLAYQQALEILTALVERYPAEADYRREMARVYNNLGLVHQATNQLDLAQHDFDQAIAMMTAMQEQYPGEPSYRQVLAKNCLNLGPVLRLRNHLNKADAVYRKAIRLLTDLKTLKPEEPEYQYQLAVALNNHGIALKLLKRSKEGEAAHLRALAFLESLTTQYPTVPVYRKELATTHNSLGLLRAREKDWPAAQRHWQRARGEFQKLAEQFPANNEYRARWGMACGNLGWMYLNQKRGWQLTPSAQNLQEAKKFLTEGIHHLRDFLEKNPNHPLFVRPYCEQLGYLIQTVQWQGDFATAKHLQSLREKIKCP